MPKKNLIRTDTFPYHITSRSNAKEWFYIPLEKVWKIMIEQLAKVVKDESLQVHSLVLMNNHFHLFASTPKANIDKIMQVFLSKTAHEVNRVAGRMNHVFGNRYKWSIVDDEKYCWHIIRYIYQNPMRARLISKVEDYIYSTLFYKVRQISLPFLLDKFLSPYFDNFLSNNDENKVAEVDREFLRWVNSQLDDELKEKIRKSLLYSYARMPKNQGRRKVKLDLFYPME